MAIKDQCEKCRFNEENGCSKLVPSFDGTSCDVYVKRINLEKDKEELQESTPVISDTQNENSNSDDNYYGYEDEDVPSDENIHGWLKFFLIFFVGIGSVATLVLSFVNFESYEDRLLSFGDVIYALIYLLTGIFAIVAFYKRDPDAVFLAKIFVIFCFGSNLLSLFLNDVSELGGDKVVVRMIRSIVWCCIWFLYLCNSNQVERIIPKSFRKTKTRDWVLIGAIVLLPLSLIGLGIASEKKSHIETETAALANLTLSQNQFTDGRIVLTIPSGVDCEETVAENTKVFSVSDSETGAEVTVVSDYDNDISKKNFNQYWRGWKSDELNSLEYEVVKDDKQSNDNVTVFYKLIRIKVEEPVDWEFALVFDHKTGKVCLVSGYSSAQGNSPVAYLINNLKFL